MTLKTTTLLVTLLAVLPLAEPTVKHLGARNLAPYIVLDTLHSLASNASEGKSPTNSMIRGNDGHLYGTTGWGASNYDGTFYKVTATGNVYAPTVSFSVLHKFNDGTVTNDGYDCLGKLAKDNSGNIYGACQSGGAYGYGTVYKINTSTGAVTILHSFGSIANDGNYPNSGLVMDASGNLYGTTNNGGTSCSGSICRGTIFKLSPSGGSWTYTKLHNFTGGTSGGDAPHSQLIASDGNLYGMTIGGGANSRGIMFKYDLTFNFFSKQLDIPAGEEMWLQGMTEIPPTYATGGGSLEFWGATMGGGVNNCGSLYKVDDSSGSFTYTIMHSIVCSGGGKGLQPRGDLVFSTTFLAGGGQTLWGTLYDGGASLDGSVFRYDYDAQSYWDLGASGSGAWSGGYPDDTPWPLVESSISGTPVLMGGSRFAGAGNIGWLWFLRAF